MTKKTGRWRAAVIMLLALTTLVTAACDPQTTMTIDDGTLDVDQRGAEIASGTFSAKGDSTLSRTASADAITVDTDGTVIDPRYTAYWTSSPRGAVNYLGIRVATAVIRMDWTSWTVKGIVVDNTNRTCSAGPGSWQWDSCATWRGALGLSHLSFGGTWNWHVNGQVLGIGITKWLRVTLSGNVYPDGGIEGVWHAYSGINT